MPYLVLRDGVTLRNEAGTALVHLAGTVLSDAEVHPHVRERHDGGDPSTLKLLKHVSEDDALEARVKQTKVVKDDQGREVTPPFEDYGGLAIPEIKRRMDALSAEDLAHLRRYEGAYMGRSQILDYEALGDSQPDKVEAPVEAPWEGYDKQSVKDIVAVLKEAPELADGVREYESAHKGRTTIVEYGVEESEPDDDE